MKSFFHLLMMLQPCQRRFFNCGLNTSRQESSDLILSTYIYISVLLNSTYLCLYHKEKVTPGKVVSWDYNLVKELFVEVHPFPATNCSEALKFQEPLEKGFVALYRNDDQTLHTNGYSASEKLPIVRLYVNGRKGVHSCWETFHSKQVHHFPTPNSNADVRMQEPHKRGPLGCIIEEL